MNGSGEVIEAPTLPAEGAVMDNEAVEGGEDAGRRRAIMKSVLLGVFGESPSLDEPATTSPRSSPSSSSRLLDNVLACPSTLGGLTEGFRSYGGVGVVRYKTTAKRPGVRVRFT